MAEPFGDQDRSEGLGKRPAPTIEGTATEISVAAPSEDTALAGNDVIDEAASEAEPGASGDTGPVIGDVASTDTMESAAPDDDPVAKGEVPDAETGAAEKPKRKGPPPRTSAFELKSFFTHLAAGLLGGLIGVVALSLFWNKLPVRQAKAPDLSGIESRLDKLESAPVPERSGDAQAVAALDARVKSLEETKPEAPADLADLTTRVSKLEATIDTLAKSAESGGSVADAAALETKLGDIEKRLRDKIDAALSDDKSASTEGIAAMQSEISTLKAKIGALAEAGLASAEATSGQDIAALDKRVSKLEGEFTDLNTEVEQNTATARSGAASLAFGDLRQAVDEGVPYAKELASFRALAAKADVGGLPAHAETGIPALAALAASFKTAAEANADKPSEPAQQSFLDSVIASARSAVQIRRLDAVETGPAGAAITDLNTGDLAAAVKAVEALPAPQREAYAAWLAGAKARLDADATLNALETSLLAAAGGNSKAEPVSP